MAACTGGRRADPRPGGRPSPVTSRPGWDANPLTAALRRDGGAKEQLAGRNPFSTDELLQFYGCVDCPRGASPPCAHMQCGLQRGASGAKRDPAQVRLVVF